MWTRQKIMGTVLACLGGFVFIVTSMFPDSPHWPQMFRNHMDMLSGQFLGGILMLAVWITGTTYAALAGQTDIAATQKNRYLLNRNDPVFIAGHNKMRALNGVNVPKWFANIPGHVGTLIYPHDAEVPFGALILLLGVDRVVDRSELSREERRIADRHGLKPPYVKIVAPYFVETRGRDYTAEIRKMELDNETEATYERQLHRVQRGSSIANAVLLESLESVSNRQRPSLWDRVLGRRTVRGDDGGLTKTQDDTGR